MLVCLYEAALLMEEHLLFPRQEMRAALHLMHMDASGQAMLCFDEAACRYWQNIFSAAEQKLFNMFKDEHNTHIAL